MSFNICSGKQKHPVVNVTSRPFDGSPESTHVYGIISTRSIAVIEEMTMTEEIFLVVVLVSTGSYVATKNVKVVHLALSELQATIQSVLDTNKYGWGQTMKKHREASLSVAQWEPYVSESF